MTRKERVKLGLQGKWPFLVSFVKEKQLRVKKKEGEVKEYR